MEARPEREVTLELFGDWHTGCVQIILQNTYAKDLGLALVNRLKNKPVERVKHFRLTLEEVE